MTTTTVEKVCRLKGDIPGFLENGGFTLLGWHHGNKEILFPFGYFSIRNGAEIRFWEDQWLGTTTLPEQYPALYNIVRYKGDTLQKVMESTLGNVQT
jgi:hypothetical protein